jgi:Kef-type K+ transport system membrane component KefB
MMLVGAAIPDGAMAVPAVLLLLAALLAGARLLGEAAERVGQPAVLGELLAGVVLGPSVLGVVNPDLPVVHVMAEIGVVILLFQIGLETNLRRLLSVGGTAATVAVVGVAVPFMLGLEAGRLLGLGQLPTLVAAAALTATSVGITARVLSDLGRLQDQESQVVLGAAVIDDIIGLIILAVVARLVAGHSLSAGNIALTTLTAFGFVAGALLVGRLIVPALFRLLARIGSEQAVAMMGLVVAFLLATLADAVGSALIIGAFTAGLVFAPTVHARPIERGVVRLGHFFVPIFFVAVGAAVDVRSFLDAKVLLVGGVLIVVAVVGKVIAGFAPFWFRGRKLVVGVGMVPRGEVGLIFAQTGLAAGVLDAGLFSAITAMVMVTTFIAPPALKALLGPAPRTGGPGSDRPGELVAEA